MKEYDELGYKAYKTWMDLMIKYQNDEINISSSELELLKSKVNRNIEFVVMMNNVAYHDLISEYYSRYRREIGA